MRYSAIAFALVLASCTTVAQPVAEAPLIQTTERRETLVLAEHAYTGAMIAAQKTLAHGSMSEDDLIALEAAAARASDALDHLRTIGGDTDIAQALFFYNYSIEALNKATEGQRAEPVGIIHEHQ